MFRTLTTLGAVLIIATLVYGATNLKINRNALFAAAFLGTTAGTPQKFVDSSDNGYGYAYAPSIISADGTWHMYYCSTGVGGTGGSWDTVRHATSQDLMHWSAPDSVVMTSDMTNERASCDPSVVYYDAGDGPYYYLFYSGNQLNTQTVNFVARSSSPTGPFAKLTTNNTWVVNAPNPKIILSPLHAVPDSVGWYGLGQPTVVAKDGKLYQWFTDTTSQYSGSQIDLLYLSVSSDPSSWPTRTVTNFVGDGVPESVDIKYDATIGQFIMFGIGNQHSASAYVFTRTSTDGITWSDATTILSAGVLPPWSNNIGVSGSRTGELLRNSIEIAYGAPYDLVNNISWAQWDLYGQVFSNPAPTGTFDAPVTDCQAENGWAYDQSDMTQNLQIHFYADGPAGAGTFLGAVTANSSRPDLGVSGNHGFSYALPSSLKDGRAHTLYGYAIDVPGGSNNPLIGNSPKTIQCAPPAQACSFNNQLVASGASVTAYQSSSVAYGSTCVSQTRTCTNGVLSGSSAYQYSSCSEGANPAPTGTFDAPVTDCQAENGWAYDQSDMTQNLQVHFYIDGPAGSGTFLGAVTANSPRPDLGVSGNHGFSYTLPSSLKDGRTHTLYGYAIDVPGGSNNPLIGNSPKTITCAASTPTATITADSASIQVGQSTVIHATFNPGAGNTLTNSNINTGPTTPAQGQDWSAQPTRTYTFTPSNIGTYTFYAALQTDRTSPNTYAQVVVTVGAAASCTFNGASVASDSTVIAYQSSTVSYGTQCVTQTRTCTNGVLSGSYANASCTVAAAQSCTLNGTTVAHGASRTFYSDAAVAFGVSCANYAQSRTCTNGMLSGNATYQYSSCAVGDANACSFNSLPVAHGASVSAYQAQSAPFGSTCASQRRVCSNGVLSGAYQYSSCSVGTAASCSFIGAGVANGASVTAYQAPSVAYGQNCVSQQRLCTDGTFSGSFSNASCTVDSVSPPTSGGGGGSIFDPPSVTPPTAPITTGASSPLDVPDQSSTGQSCVLTSKNLAIGSRGADVLSLQKFFISQGLLTTDSASGYFGQLTMVALQTWQKAHGVVTDGAPATTVIQPTASLTVNGSASQTVNSGGVTAFAWSSANGSSYSSTFTVNSPDACGNGVGPNAWGSGNTANGSFNYTWTACSAGHTYTYLYRVQNSAGFAVTSSASVTVTALPACTMTASPNPIIRGQNSSIGWTSSNSTSGTINPGAINATPVAGGSFSAAPINNTSYSGSFTGPGGTSACTPVTLVVNCAPIYSCSSQTIQYTDALCNTSNVTTCVSPQYCTAGQSACTIPQPVFNPAGARSGHLQANPQVVRKGLSTKIFWNITNVQSCTISGNNGNTLAPGCGSNTCSSGVGGQSTIAINSTVTYTLACTNLAGATPASFTEKVNVLPSPEFQEQ